MNERNRSPILDEVNIKPITSERVDPANYQKGAYLKPFQHQRRSSGLEEPGVKRNDGDSLGLQP